jgi:CDP-diacylglycerol---glycerol-3-phosphate 3-phosphatidyltransferase
MVRFIPNILTLGRLALSVVFLLMLLYSPHVPGKALFLDMAFVIFIVAGLTDIVDGMVARRFGVTTKFGRIVDPLADKILVCGAFVCFAIIGEPRLFDLTPSSLAVIHWGTATILILREAYVTGLRHWAEGKGINFAATASGKIKMFLQSFAIGTILIKMAHVPSATWGYWFTMVTLLVMLTATVTSGLLATRRPCLQRVSEPSPVGSARTQGS